MASRFVSLPTFGLAIGIAANVQRAKQDERLRRTIFMYELRWVEETLDTRNIIS